MSGFSDRQQPALTGEAHDVTGQLEQPSGTKLRATVRLGPGGRVVIPAEMRDMMGLKQGDAMLATLEDGELRLVTLGETVRQLQAITSKHVPEGVSLVDEFLAERRAMWGEDD
jgi:AbrB family looped-hinge helix DNA binding protein